MQTAPRCAVPGCFRRQQPQGRPDATRGGAALLGTAGFTGTVTLGVPGPFGQDDLHGRDTYRQSPTPSPRACKAVLDPPAKVTWNKDDRLH